MAKSLEQIKASKTYKLAVDAYGVEVANKAAAQAEVNEEPMIVALDRVTDKLGL